MVIKYGCVAILMKVYYGMIKQRKKTTKEKMLELYAFVLLDEMRTQRNKLLGESDFRVLPDYEKDKDLWIQYRKKTL